MLISGGRLSPEQVSLFNEDGYLIIDNVFDPADLEPIRQDLEREIDRKLAQMLDDGKLSQTYPEASFEQRVTRIYHDSRENGEEVLRHLEGARGGGYQGRCLFDLITHPKLLDVVSDLIGPEIVASSAYRIRPKISGVGRGDVPWHQDSGYFAPHCDRHLILTCWIPLVDATVENGCMEIIPKSHKSGIFRHQTGGNMGLYVIKDEDLPATQRNKVAAECPRGGVVLMTNLTAHCSTPNYSDTIRWSLDLRYQSADAPNNVNLWPGSSESDADANTQIACYPPEADFIVRSSNSPESVVDYDGFVSRRAAYEDLGIASPRQWAPIS